jgi:hypothetical protein
MSAGGPAMLGPMIGRFIAVAFLGLAVLTAPARAQSQGDRADVVVELYTSQGCTQCPRANRLLGSFARENGVLALTFPVGMWDYLGWHDTFALPEFSDRQRKYARTLRTRGRFTPQLVLNGARQLSASDWDDARVALEQAQAASRTLARDDISLTRLPGGRVRVTLNANARGAGADVWLVAYDPGPLAVVVGTGLNRNRTVLHYNLVRTMDRLDTWNGRSVWYERPRCAPECAVIVQTPEGGPILGAAFTGRRVR